MRRVLASPFAAALLGGAIVAGAMLIAGVGDVTNRTIVKEAAAPEGAAEGSLSAKGQLTPAEIYERDAPGVVYITATVVEQTQSPFDLFPSTRRGASSALRSSASSPPIPRAARSRSSRPWRGRCWA